jgi:hypothetical protein
MGGCFARKAEEAKAKPTPVQVLHKQLLACSNPCMIPGNVLQDGFQQYNRNLEHRSFTVYCSAYYVLAVLDLRTQQNALKSLMENAHVWVGELLESSFSFQVIGKLQALGDHGVLATSTLPSKFSTTASYIDSNCDRDVEEIVLCEDQKMGGPSVPHRKDNADIAEEGIPSSMETYIVGSMSSTTVDAIKGLTHAVVRIQEEKLLDSLNLLRSYYESILGGIMPFKGNSLTFNEPAPIGLKFQNESGTLEQFSFCLGPLSSPNFGMALSLLIEKPWLFKQFIDSEKSAGKLYNQSGHVVPNINSNAQVIKMLHKPFNIFPMILCIQGIWKIVPISSLLPYSESSDYALLTQSVQQEYWLTLLEKSQLLSLPRPDSISKRLKHPGYWFHDMTGAPYKEIPLKQVFLPSSGEAASKALEILLDDILSKGYSCGLWSSGQYSGHTGVQASSDNTNDNGEDAQNTVKGVCYTLVSRLKLQTGAVLYCIRYPWNPRHRLQQLALNRQMALMQCPRLLKESKGCSFASSQDILENFDTLFCGLVDPRGVQYYIKGHPTKQALSGSARSPTQPFFFFELSVKAETIQEFYLQLCQEEVFMNHPRQILQAYHTIGLFVLSVRGGGGTTAPDEITERDAGVRRMMSNTGTTFHQGPATTRRDSSQSETPRIIQQWLGTGRDCWKKLQLGSGTYQILVYSASSYDADSNPVPVQQLDGKSPNFSINLNLHTTSNARVKLVSTTPAYFCRKTGYGVPSDQGLQFCLKSFLTAALATLPQPFPVVHEVLIPSVLLRSPLVVASSPLTKLFYENKSGSQDISISVEYESSGCMQAHSSWAADSQLQRTPLILRAGESAWLGFIRHQLQSTLRLSESVLFLN